MKPISHFIYKMDVARSVEQTFHRRFESIELSCAQSVYSGPKGLQGQPGRAGPNGFDGFKGQQGRPGIPGNPGPEGK